jgi:UDP-glucose 4-epimerase
MQAATELGCQRLVLVGSGDEPTSGGTPCSPYAAAKAGQTSYARMFHELYGTPVTTARVFMAYGPDQPDESKIVPYSVLKLLRGERPALSSGRRRCDWIYIDDVVDALVALASVRGVTGQVVDIGSGTLRTVRHVVEAIVELTGANVTPAWGQLADRPGETEDVADAKESARVSGWSASTDLRAGLERTVRWYGDREASRR